MSPDKSEALSCSPSHSELARQTAELGVQCALHEDAKISDALAQVWSLSSFEVSRQLLKNVLNEVSSVSLFMTSSTALANEGLFELTWSPSLTRAVICHLHCHLRYYRETRLYSGEKATILSIFGQILAFSPDYNLVTQ